MLLDEEKGHIIGVQANHVDGVYPYIQRGRVYGASAMAALSEVQWKSREGRTTVISPKAYSPAGTPL